MLFVKDLTNYIKKCKIILCADDTALMFADNNVENIKSNLELDLTNAHKWLVKTNYTLMSAKQSSCRMEHTRG